MTLAFQIAGGILLVMILVALQRILNALLKQHEQLTQIELVLAKGLHKEIEKFNKDWSEHHLNEIFVKAMKQKEENKDSD